MSKFYHATLGGSSCHHSMERPRVAAMEQWKLAANILNKQPQTNDKGRYSSLEVGRGAKNPSP
jgi:hypothetical protein